MMKTRPIENIIKNTFREFIKLNEGKYSETALETLCEDICENVHKYLYNQAHPILEAPHPRSRIYRSEPEDWNIEDIAGTEALKILLDAANKPATKPHACIFDLDGTLFDVGHRTLGILQEWAKSTSAKRFPEHLVEKLAAVSYHHMGYSVLHALENAGFDLRNEEVVEFFLQIEKEWRKRFFDGKSLLQFDKPIVGAYDFLHTLNNKGIKIIYLTGRFALHMLQGTKEQLEQALFPTQKSDLYLKPDLFTDDVIYKAQSVQRIAKDYNIIGNFENEYVNIAAMIEHAPKANHFILDSQHSGRKLPAKPCSIYRLTDFISE